MALSTQELAALSKLLEQALEQPASAREAWLEALPPEHLPLAQRLRGLLAVADDPASPLQTLPGLSLPVTNTGSPGDRIGPWRLQREVGRGGMGSVWLAERADGAYERLVALKLPSAAWSESLLQRMASECRIAARLEHPAIARLYDAGLDQQGRPYIAMEFVDGSPIDTSVRQQRLDVAQTLALYLQVLEAVAFAHGRLVVHRDLKPSNVMVATDGRVQLLDFGIARLLQDGDAADAHALEQGRVLTPHYAAPEELAGAPASVQADVYSLGVMLYELLTGMLPYRLARPGLGALAALETQRPSPPLPEPPVASTRLPDDRARSAALRGEVDAILAKALQHDPARRYATVDAFAEDIRRHLRGESISALPYTAWQALGKALRRHRRAVLVSSVVALALLLGGGGALLQARSAQQAQAREQQARGLVGELLALSQPGMSQEQALQAQSELVRRRLPDDPRAQAELYGQLAATFLRLGLAHAAAQHAGQQVALLERTGGGAAERVQAQLRLGRAELENQRVEAAEEAARQALKLAQGGVAQADTVLDTAARVLLVRVLHRQARRDEAAAVAQGIVRTPAPEGPQALLAEAWLEHTAAVLRRQGADFAGSEPRYHRAIELARRAGPEGATDAAQMQLDLAYELIVRNRRNEALALMEPALATLAARGPSGAILAAGQRAALVTNMALMGQIPAQEALDGLAVLRLLLLQHGSSLNPMATARLDFHRARLLGVRGHVREAHTLMAQAVPVLLTQTQWPNARFSLVNAHGRLALIAGEHTQAETLLRQALALRNEMGQARIPFAAVTHTYRVMNSLMTGQLQTAEAALDAAPAFPPEPSDPVAGAVYATLLPWHRVRLKLAQGDLAGARALAAPLGRGEDDPDTDFISPTAIHAELACASGRARDGLSQLEAMLARRIQEADAGLDPQIARLRALSGLCQLALGRPQQARVLAGEAARAFARQPEVSSWFKQPLQDLQRRLGGWPAAQR